jgi:hypothetical protein
LEQLLPKIEKLLLSVGAMKSGTTWLYRQLQQHPHINFSYEKEIHFLAYLDGHKHNLGFNYRRSRWSAAKERAATNKTSVSIEERLWYSDYLYMPKTWQWYKRRFGQVSKGQYCADFSNLTALLGEPAWASLKEHVDDIRLVYVLRNPLDRIWSHIKFYYQLIGEQNQLQTMQSYTHDPRLPESELTQHSMYAQNLQRIFSVVPQEQVHVVLYDDIGDRPQALLEELEAFLQIPGHRYLPGKVGRKINASQAMSRPEWINEHFYPKCAGDLQLLREMNVAFPDSWWA